MQQQSIRIVLDPVTIVAIAAAITLVLGWTAAALMRRHRLNQLAVLAASYFGLLEHGGNGEAPLEEIALAYDHAAFAYNTCRELPFSRMVAPHYSAINAPYGMSAVREALWGAGFDEADEDVPAGQAIADGAPLHEWAPPQVPGGGMPRMPVGRDGAPLEIPPQHVDGGYLDPQGAAWAAQRRLAYGAGATPQAWGVPPWRSGVYGPADQTKAGAAPLQNDGTWTTGQPRLTTTPPSGEPLSDRTTARPATY